MRGAIHEAVDRARLLLLAVALLWGCVPTAHALRSPTPLPSLDWSQPGQQLKEENGPLQKTPLFGEVGLTLENAPVTAKSRTRSLGPFGSLTLRWGPMGGVNRIMFSSKEHLSNAEDIYDFGRRDWFTSPHRWLTRDPIGEAGGINLYGFVGNNPINAIDPDGLDSMVPGVNGTYNNSVPAVTLTGPVGGPVNSVIQH